MIQDKNKIFLELYQVVDFLVLGLAFLLAYFTKIALVPGIVRGLATNQNYTLVFLLASISCQFNLRFAETYPPYAHIQFRHLFAQITKAISFGILHNRRSPPAGMQRECRSWPSTDIQAGRRSPVRQ